MSSPSRPSTRQQPSRKVKADDLQKLLQQQEADAFEDIEDETEKDEAPKKKSKWSCDGVDTWNVDKLLLRVDMVHLVDTLGQSLGSPLRLDDNPLVETEVESILILHDGAAEERGPGFVVLWETGEITNVMESWIDRKAVLEFDKLVSDEFVCLLRLCGNGSVDIKHLASSFDELYDDYKRERRLLDKPMYEVARTCVDYARGLLDTELGWFSKIRVEMQSNFGMRIGMMCLKMLNPGFSNKKKPEIIDWMQCSSLEFHAMFNPLLHAFVYGRDATGVYVEFGLLDEDMYLGVVWGHVAGVKYKAKVGGHEIDTSILFADGAGVK